MTTPTATTNPALTGRLFTDDDFDFNARNAIGKATQGTYDLGVAVHTLGRITDGDPESWLREWTNTADRLHRQAVAGEQAGQQQTAAWFYLGAADAYARAMAFIDGLADDSALVPTFQQHRICWEAFVNASRGRHVRFDIACQDTTLPGYLFRPDSSGVVRPTLVITNGSDGSLSGLWGEGIKAPGPGMERLRLRRPGPAVAAVRAGHPVSARLGAGAHAGGRRAAHPR